MLIPGQIKTLTGGLLDLLNPNPDNININDIASGLGFKAHFSGQIPHYFSIAEHSTLCVDLAPKNTPAKVRLFILLHDAAEAYIGDLVKPIKVIPEMEIFWKPFEEKILMAILKKFDVLDIYKNDDWYIVMKDCDNRAQKIERDTFYSGYNGPELKNYSPELSRWIFIKYFNDLKKEIYGIY